MISLTLDCSSLSHSLHDQSNLHGAGSNHAGQLGVGGTADVQEPQVLQVCFWCQCSLLPFHLHQHPHWQMQGGSKRFVEGQQMFQAGQLQTVRLPAALSTPDAVMQQA